MRDPGRPHDRRSAIYQTAVLGISAAVIIGTWILVAHLFQSSINRPGGVTVGLAAVGQVLDAAAPHGPASDQLPGLVGTPTVAADASEVPTLVPTSTATATPQIIPTRTPDTRFYDPARAKTLLAQAQTSYGNESPEFVANATLAAQRINNQTVAPGSTFSFDSLVGPFSVQNGYRQVSTIDGKPTVDVPPVEGGITQVSTAVFQAAFWSGLKIVERHTHPYWLDRLNAGSTAQRGLDAYVDYPADDLRVQNSTGDWIRIETSVQSGSISVSIYGVDPGWSVNPEVGTPVHVAQPSPTQTVRPDPSLPPGQQFTVFRGAAGFDVTIQREVTKQGETLDRYGVNEHYQPMPAIIVVGAQPTPTPVPATEPTDTPTNGQGPTHLAGLDPSAYVLPDGRIRTPNLVGLSEDEAQRVITAVGLQTTYVNYQGPGDVPPAALNSVPVNHVLSQNPAPGAAVGRGTRVYIAVRK